MKSTVFSPPVTRRRLIPCEPAGMRCLALAILCTVAIVTAGCRIVAPRLKVNARVHSQEDIAANTEAMRLKARAMVQPLCGVIVASADQIMAGTTNRAIRRQALLWKIEAVPALREALFQPSPLAAVFDGWVMSFQMAEYFQRGAGRERLGDAHVIAVAASQHLERELGAVTASFTISGDVADARGFAKQWAADHPIRQSISSRESILNQAVDKGLPKSYTATEMVGNLSISVDDLNRRIEIYSAQLLDQARWQAELFTMDMTGDLKVDQALPLATSAVESAGRAVESMDRLVPSVERTLSVLEKVPELVAIERTAMISAIQAELSRTIAFAQEERIAALRHITTERIAAVKELHDAIVQERRAMTQDLDRMSVNVVDHAFLRAAQLCGAVLVVAFIGMVVLLLLVRRLFKASLADAVARLVRETHGGPTKV